MKKLNGRTTACAVFMLCLAGAVGMHAQAFKTLANFDGRNGANPMTSLVQGTDGNLYGTTMYGGFEWPTKSLGTVFKISATGELTTLYKFCHQSNCADGSFPMSALTLATDGNLYGVTSWGGLGNYGTVFKITPFGKLTTVTIFCSLENCADGAIPLATLVQASDGYLYGTTDLGGTYGGGTIFKISMSGELKTLYSFCWGCNPGSGTLVEGPDGSFYGTAEAGQNGSGTIFKITPSGKFSTLYNFCSQPSCTDGDLPNGGLILASDGNLYGTTVAGGLNNCAGYLGGGCGTVFKITLTGDFTTLYRFCAQPSCADGGNPWAGLIQATDGALYGTASAGGIPGLPPLCVYGVPGGCGTTFKITPTGLLKTLYSFVSPNNGWSPTGGLVQTTNGVFYGTTTNGGYPGYGTIFGVSTGLEPFAALVPRAGKVGRTVRILGQSLSGATNVSFNGTSTSFTVKSDTLILATVPSGATIGYVTVTTPTKVLTSNVPFYVIQ